MQGMMGSYLEKNVQAFTDIQHKFTGTSAGSFEGKPFSPEMWTQFMNVQGPMMQGMMNNYIDQSKSLFVQMQEQMQNQSKNLFGTFPFVPPVPPTTRSSRCMAHGRRCCPYASHEFLYRIGHRSIVLPARGGSGYNSRFASPFY
jgi:secreted PhoX family phosphatase